MKQREFRAAEGRVGFSTVAQFIIKLVHELHSGSVGCFPQRSNHIVGTRPQKCPGEPDKPLSGIGTITHAVAQAEIVTRSASQVKLTVVSEAGKEATIGILNEGAFFGESCLTGQPLRLCSAIALTDCSVMRIDKKSMMEVLHREHAFSDMFVAYLLTRNIRYEEDLVDQLFNSSEKRLARVLLLLAHFGKDGKPESVIPTISQETLAEMVGTTRSRVSFFMNRFGKLGVINYQGERAGSHLTFQHCSSPLEVDSEKRDCALAQTLPPSASPFPW